MEKYYSPAPESDDAFYGPQGKFNTEQELKRLERVLAEAPTTLEEDEASLKNGKVEDW